MTFLNAENTTRCLRHCWLTSSCALALLAASIPTADQAVAACTPVSPVNNATVTCTGATTDANGTTGYGSSTDTGNTINIGAGASVTGTTFGIRQGRVTINNDGAIAGAAGVDVEFDVKLNNTGSISSTAVDASAVFSLSTATIHNSGTIAAINNAINIVEGTVINDSTGVISAVNGRGVLAQGAVDILNAGTISAATIGVDFLRQVFPANKLANSGIITAGNYGVNSRAAVAVSNSGSIFGTGINGVGINAVDVAVTSNTGTISGTYAAINATHDVVLTNTGGNVLSNGAAIFAGNDATISNTGRIHGDNLGISAAGSANVINSGTINSNGTTLFGTIVSLANSGTVSTSSSQQAVFGQLVNVTNSGAITADNGVAITGVTANVSNTKDGTISGLLGAVSGVDVVVHNDGIVRGTGTIGAAIGANGSLVVSNSGAISAQSFGVYGSSVDLVNSGSITVNATNGIAVGALLTNVNVVNSGTIIASGANGHGIEASAGGGFVSVTNSGSISGDGAGVFAASANVTNSGGIIGGARGIEVGTLGLNNSGNIAATGTNGYGVRAGTGSIFNSGSVTGNVGIQFLGAATITNSGTITGTDGTAIRLSNAADTLTLLPGSRINGVVDMGFGADVVNAAVVAPSSRISSLTSITLPTLINFEGTLNTSFSAGGFIGPMAQSGLQLATLDPTALAQTDRALLDFTGGASSLVQGRLNGASPSSNGMMAMAYAPEDTMRGPFAKAAGRDVGTNPAPITVWANSFGGRRAQDATAMTLGATTTSWGGAIGIDRKLRPDWLVGAFVGGGAGTLSVDLGSQTVDTDYVFGGGYSRFAWDSQFIDVTVQGGNAANRSRRLVLENGGTQTATASYNGWFISPEIAYGRHIAIGNDYVLTPMARLRYVAGLFDGYSEAGSAQGLRIGSRTLQNVEERGELDISKVTSFFGGDHLLKTNLHGGVVAMQRVGDTVVNAVLIGQSLSFATPGSGSTVGAVIGVGFDYHTSRNVAIFGAVEAMVMSDQGRTGTAKGGLRVAF